MTAAALAQEAFAVVLRNSAAAAAVAILVLLAQRFARDRISARWRHNLWLLVVLRLVLPPLPGVRLPAVHWPQSRLASETVARTLVPPSVSNAHRTLLRRPASIASAVAPVADAQTQPPPPQTVDPSPASLRTLKTQRIELLTSNAAAPAPIMARETEVSPSASPRPQATLVAARTVEDGLAGHAVTVLPVKASVAAPGDPLPHSPIPWLPIATMIWLTGVLVFAGRIFWASVRLGRATSRLRPVADPAVRELLDDCCRLLRVRRAPLLLEAPAFAGPALIGALHPRLLLPPCVLSGFAWRELRLIVLHELSHLKRRDVPLNYLLSVLQAAHWFNPLVWLAFARLRAERELACDEAVLRATPWRESRAYGSTILKLLDVLCRGLTVPAGAIGVIQHRALMHRRIAMIAHFDRTRPHWTASGVLLSLAVGGAALATAVITRAQDAPAAPEAPTAAVAPSTPDGPVRPEREPRAENTIQPGDQLQIVVSDPDGKIETEHRIRVAEDGTVSSPDERVTSRRFRAVGRTAEQLRKQIQKSYSRYAPDPDRRVMVEIVPLGGSDPRLEPAAGPAGAEAGQSIEQAQSAIERAAADPAAPAAQPPGVAIEPPAGQQPVAPAAGRVVPDPDAPAPPGVAPAEALPAPEVQAPPGAPAAGALPVPTPDAGLGRPTDPALPRGYPLAPAGRGSLRSPSHRDGEPADAFDRGNPPDRTVEDADATRANEKVLESLQHPVRLQATQEPLRDLLENVGQQAGVDVVIDERAMRDNAGLDLNVAVTMTLREPRPADQLLRLALRLAAGSQLDYTVVNGTVLVSTRDELARHVVTRVYDLHDIEGDRSTIAQIVERSTNPESVVFLNPDRLLVTSSENNQREVSKLLAALRQPQATGRSRRTGVHEPDSTPQRF